MSEMPAETALEIAITALQPHFSVELKSQSIISVGLKKLSDDRLGAIKEDAEDLAQMEGYGTRVPFHRLKSGIYHRVIHLADEIFNQSWPLPDHPLTPSGLLAASKKKPKKIEPGT